jgi:Caspase domain
MKIFFLFAILFGFATVKGAPPKVYAVVVGVSQYADQNIHALDFAALDAAAFAKFLQSPNAGAVPPENMRVLLNRDATRSKIIKAITELFSRSGKEDLILFYFAGHGKNDVMENVGYLLPADTEDGNEPGTAISMEEITSRIYHSKAKMKVSFIDACHAGMFRTAGARGSSNDNAEIIKAYTIGLSNASEGNVAFLACSARQESLEDKKLQQGYFTHYLIEGLQGSADKEQKGSAGFNNGIVTMGELRSYLISKVQQATQFKQVPSVEGQYDDDFPLSILRSDMVLSSEIAKRPTSSSAPNETRQKINEIANVEPEQSAVQKITTKEMEERSCTDKTKNLQYSKVCFDNRTGVDLTLVRYFGFWSSPVIDEAQALPTGQVTCTGKLLIDYLNASSERDFTFHFATEDGTPCKLTYRITLEKCQQYTIILTKKDLGL